MSHYSLAAKRFSGALVSLALILASPATAQIGQRAQQRHNDGIGAGEVIAGAVVVGGLIALIASSEKKKDRERTRYDYLGVYDYERYGDSESAIEACVGEAREYLADHGYVGEIDQITDIDRTGYGYDIDGHVIVTADERGSYEHPDYGSFVCRVDYGRIAHFAVEGIS